MLAGLDGITVADRGVEQCGIVTCCADQCPAEALQVQLAARHINTTTVPFSANPVSAEQRRTPTLLRASLHYYNTDDELERFVAELADLL